MGVIQRQHVALYYEELGDGEPVIAIHGLMEDAGYWTESGFADRIAPHYRLIAMDMRGHGRTRVDGPPFGYDVATIGNDIAALASALDIDRFHLLSHATGGMAAARYAMTSSERLLSLTLTGTGSATIPFAYRKGGSEMLKRLRRGADKRRRYSAEEWMRDAREEPGPFLATMAAHPDCERMWALYERFIRRSDPAAISQFMLSFFADPDPMVLGLRQIRCPTLVLVGEHDVIFREPSRILADEIPGAELRVMDGIGHMNAIEDPARTADEILDFLQRC
jgi:pimeloyl-ACP methyl ester carboxylesterase